MKQTLDCRLHSGLLPRGLISLRRLELAFAILFGTWSGRSFAYGVLQKVDDAEVAVDVKRCLLASLQPLHEADRGSMTCRTPSNMSCAADNVTTSAASNLARIGQSSGTRAAGASTCGGRSEFCCAWIALISAVSCNTIAYKSRRAFKVSGNCRPILLSLQVLATEWPGRPN